MGLLKTAPATGRAQQWQEVEERQELPLAARLFWGMLAAIGRGLWLAVESLLVLIAKAAWDGMVRWPRPAATLYGVVWAVAAPPLWLPGRGWWNVILWLWSPILPAVAAWWWHRECTGDESPAAGDPATVWSQVIAGDPKVCAECGVFVGPPAGLPVWVEGRGETWCQPHAPRARRGLTTVTEGPS